MNDPATTSVEKVIDRATEFCQRLEDMVAGKGSFTIRDEAGRDWLLMAHWSLVLDYCKSIFDLILHKFYGGAFALLRLLTEAELRSFVVVVGSEDDIAKIKADTYRINFKTIGGEIDAKLFPEGFFAPFLKMTIESLHSYTHSGRAQLARRFKGKDLEIHYTDNEIIDVIQLSSIATWLVTVHVLLHFQHLAEARASQELFLEWCKHLQVTGRNTLTASSSPTA